MKKVRFILLILIAVVLYLLIGAVTPFVHTKDVGSSYGEKAEQQNFYGDGTGPDRAKLVETNEGALEERLRLISIARKELILTTFDMRDGESTRDILAALLDAADRGVQVRILVDGISTSLRMEGKEVFYALSAHPNVELKSYNPLNLLFPWKTQGRMHDKYVIADNKAYLLGGRNTFDYFIGDYPTEHRSHDREVLIYNTVWAKESSRESSLYSLKEYFEKIWAQPDCRLFHPEETLLRKEKVQKETEALKERYCSMKEKWPELLSGAHSYDTETVETGKVTLLYNPTGIYGKEPWVFYSLQRLMAQADSRVVIHSPYAVCNKKMYEGLKEIAEKVPGAKLVINSVENGDNFVASSDYHYQKNKLIATGISLYEYDGGNSYHGKSILIDDDLSVIGSYNLDMRSTYVDTELMLVIHSSELNAQLSGNMEAIEEDCRKVLGPREYETPEHVKVQKVSPGKKAAFYIVGFVLQFFRYLV